MGVDGGGDLPEARLSSLCLWVRSFSQDSLRAGARGFYCSSDLRWDFGDSSIRNGEEDDYVHEMRNGRKMFFFMMLAPPASLFGMLF